MYFKDEITKHENELAGLNHKAFAERKTLTDDEFDRVFELKDLIEKRKNQSTEIERVVKNAVSKKWTFEHIVFYLSKLGLPLNDVNKLVAELDL